MAKEIQSRLPQAQQRVTQQYSAPNPRGPQRPADLAAPAPYDPSLANAANRLIASLNKFGKTVQTQALERVDEEERIRIAKMTHAEAEEELRKQARAAEQQGTIAVGTNPFRIKVAQQYAAERVMRASFHDALTKSTHQFSNPLNTKANAEQFARDTFQQMEFPGHFAQARAAELYSEMTTQWLSQVRQQRSARAVRQNQDDLRNGVFGVLQEYDSGDMAGGYNELVERIQTMSDEYYSLAGDAGREHVISGVEAYMRNAIGQALKDNDEDDLRELRILYNRMSETRMDPLKPGESPVDRDEFTLPDVFKWGTQHSESWGQIDSLLDQAEDSIDDGSVEEQREAQFKIDQAVRAEIGRRAAEGETPLTGSQTDPIDQPFLAQLAEEYGQSAVYSYTGGGAYRNLVEGDAKAAAKTPKDVMDEYYNKLGQHNPDFTAISVQIENDERLSDKDSMELQERIDARRLRRTGISKDINIDPETEAPRQAATASETRLKIVEKHLDQAFGLSQVTQDVVTGFQTWQQQEVARARREAKTDEDREAAIEATWARTNKVMEDVLSDDASNINMDAAREAGLPSSLLKNLEEIDHGQNLRRLQSEREQVTIEDATDAGDVGLQGAWALEPAFIDNIDDVSELHEDVKTATTPVRRKRAEAQITRYNIETQQNATEIAHRLRTDGVYGGSVRVFADGFYFVSMSDPEVRGQPNEMITARYLQALRLSGLTPEMMGANSDLVEEGRGLNFDNF